jgi:hypothetical protein
MGISFHRGPTGEPVRGLIYQGLQEMDEGGSRNGAFLSEEVQCGGPLGRAPLLGTLKDMLRKASLCPRGTCNQEGGSCTGNFE